MAVDAFSLSETEVKEFMCQGTNGFEKRKAFDTFCCLYKFFIGPTLQHADALTRLRVGASWNAAKKVESPYDKEGPQLIDFPLHFQNKKPFQKAVQRGGRKILAVLLLGRHVMNTFWSMSTSSARKRPETEEKALAGEPKNSPPRTAPKKQLPPIPKNAVPVTKPISPALPAQSTNGTHASYGPFYLEYSLLAEFTLVVKQKLPGVYIQPSYQSALMWFGVIFIRHGLYQDGVFKFTVYIPDNYPDGDCPRLVFDSPIFHPLVDPVSGELDVKRAFAKWRRNHNHIWQILMYARRVFYKIDTATPLNPEAAVLYEKDIQLFKSKVVDTVKLCSSHLFDPPKIEDPYAISFSPWNPAVHDEAREKMLSHKKSEDQQGKSTQVSGLSWVKPGSVQPFSKEEKTLPT